MSNSKNLDCRIGHANKCCGMPKYPEESLYNELKSSLSEDQLNLYKNRVEKYYGHLDIEFPWDEE